jgi:hypothetical protein
VVEVCLGRATATVFVTTEIITGMILVAPPLVTTEIIAWSEKNLKCLILWNGGSIYICHVFLFVLYTLDGHCFGDYPALGV